MRRPPPQFSIRRLWMVVRADARRYRRPASSRGFWSVVAYRVRRTRRYGGFPAKALLPIDVLFALIKPWLGDVEISSGADIGPGFHLPHPQCVTIGVCRIGPRAAVFQGVTLGSWKGQFPLVRARASIFGGAKVMGGVVIGRHAFIGANCVVTRHVPDYCTAIGCATNLIVAPQPRDLGAPPKFPQSSALYSSPDGAPARPSRHARAGM